MTSLLALKAINHTNHNILITNETFLHQELVNYEDAVNCFGVFVVNNYF